MPILLQNPARAVATIFFLSGALFGAWASRIPSLKSSFQLSADELGWLLLLMAFGAILSFSIAGEAINRLGAVRVTRVTALAYGVALLFIGLSPSIELLIVAVFVFGAFLGAMDVAMNAWGAEVGKQERQTILPGLHAIFSVGAGLGALSGSYTIFLGLDVKTHFLLFGAATTIVCVFLASIKWQSEIAGKSQSTSYFALPKGDLLLVGIIAFCASLGEGAMADWSGVYLVETIRARESYAGLGYAAFSVCIVIIRFSGGPLVTRFGEVSMVRTSGILAFVGVLIVIAKISAVISIIGFGIIGLGYALIIPLAFSRAANDTSQPTGTAIAGVATLGYGGLLLGPPVIGFLAEIYSLNSAFILLAILAVVVVIFARSMQSA